MAIQSELLAATEDQSFIYQNHRRDDAITRFQKYLRVSRRISKADKADAQKPSADSRNLFAKQGGSTPASTADGTVRGASKEERERVAKKACLTGDPTKGVEVLTDLFIDTNDPTYIFNQGRCYEQANQFEDAVGRFREYLRKAKQASEADKNEAKAHISDCLRLLGKKEAESAEHPNVETARPASEAGAATSVAVPPTLSAVPVDISAGSGESSRTGPSGTRLSTAGIATASVGGAVLIAGLIFNIEYNSIVDRLPNHYNSGDESRSSTYKTLAIVGYGAGAACLAGGAILYFFGRKTGGVTVVPSVAASQLGAVLGGTF